MSSNKAGFLLEVLITPCQDNMGEPKGSGMYRFFCMCEHTVMSQNIQTTCIILCRFTLYWKNISDVWHQHYRNRSFGIASHGILMDQACSGTSCGCCFGPGSVAFCSWVKLFLGSFYSAVGDPLSYWGRPPTLRNVIAMGTYTWFAIIFRWKWH